MLQTLANPIDTDAALDRAEQIIDRLVRRHEALQAQRDDADCDNDVAGIRRVEQEAEAFAAELQKLAPLLDRAECWERVR
ncbi:hypothetical protein [Roseomonas mucosa]|uniref:hypothetical protein n=1 Tax=Roseomonas mucosa TaxID=207340 RepID=UPI00224649E8|nr:hypothetical protein [Roseomonas mucosa]UZO91746.1 Hypothetical protein RMP42_05828 [Roseomonas mucosa]